MIWMVKSSIQSNGTKIKNNAKHTKIVSSHDFHMHSFPFYIFFISRYKDGHEFYRYVPRSMPPALVFELPGINVDVSWFE